MTGLLSKVMLDTREGVVTTKHPSWGTCSYGYQAHYNNYMMLHVPALKHRWILSKPGTFILCTWLQLEIQCVLLVCGKSWLSTWCIHLCILVTEWSRDKVIGIAFDAVTWKMIWAMSKDCMFCCKRLLVLCDLLSRSDGFQLRTCIRGRVRRATDGTFVLDPAAEPWWWNSLVQPWPRISLSWLLLNSVSLHHDGSLFDRSYKFWRITYSYRRSDIALFGVSCTSKSCFRRGAASTRGIAQAPSCKSDGYICCVIPCNFVSMLCRLYVLFSPASCSIVQLWWCCTVYRCCTIVIAIILCVSSCQ